MFRKKKPSSRTLKGTVLLEHERKEVSEPELESPFPLSTDDEAVWHAYWQSRFQVLRTKPEISSVRQNELKRHLKIPPSIERGDYPFKDVKLHRADIEWLLAQKDTEQKAVDLSTEGKIIGACLDVRGADLRQVDLSHLPLIQLCGGLTFDEWYSATEEQRSKAIVQLAGANLSGAQLTRANLRGAQLQGVDLNEAQLAEANLSGAQLAGANLSEAQLAGANLSEAQLQGADFSGANLEGADLFRAKLEDANLSGANLQQAGLIGAQLNGANLSGANLQQVGLIEAQLNGANLFRVQLEGSDLFKAQLTRANLSGAQLGKANLSESKLEGAELFRAHLEGASLFRAQLKGANLNEAQLQRANLSKAQLQGTNLKGTQLQGVDLRDANLIDEQSVGPQLVDAQWGDTNLAVVNWSKVTMLGDEHQAREKQTLNTEKKDKAIRLDEFRTAVRANRQLVVAFQSQGLNEDAARFAYRSQRLQRIVLRRQHKFVQYSFSLFLDLLAGYGYRPVRSVIWYIATISIFTFLYYFISQCSKDHTYHFAWYEALIFSITSFHGRGFFQLTQSPGTQVAVLATPVAILAAIEAIVGLIIEISFIATFTQRYFGK